MESSHDNDQSINSSRICGVKRKEILEKKKSTYQLIKAASADKDPIASFPEYRHYNRNGLSVCLETAFGNKLSSSVKQYIQNLLKANMERWYGSEWDAEEKDKRKEMVAPEARYILIYELTDSNTSGTSSTLASEKRLANCIQCRGGPMVGFVHYRFTTEEDVPVLYLYEIQLESHIQGYGLGKFLMQLVELIACKMGVGAVILTVQKANLPAMKFYTREMRYVVASISPSRVDPLTGDRTSYEILCKAFDNEAFVGTLY